MKPATNTSRKTAPTQNRRDFIQNANERVTAEFLRRGAQCRDVILLNHELRFGFMDRLRILFLGRVEVRHRIYTQSLPGFTATESVVDVPHLRDTILGEAK